MTVKNKFYEFNNVADETLDIMVYGEIISGGEDAKWDSTDVCFQDFKNALDNLGTTKTINLYVNSVGGSVITTQGIIAMLQRAKDKGVIINSYIDGIGASCASFLPMVSTNIYAYNSSLLMIHKPMSGAWGNADDMQKSIDVLNKMEDSVMLPLYMSKAKDGVTDVQIKDLLSKETWLDAKEMSDLFDITILEQSKDLVACINANDKNVLNTYKNMPQNLIDKLKDKVVEVVVDDITPATNTDTCICKGCNHSDNCQSSGCQSCICANCSMVDSCSKPGTEGCKCCDCTMAQTNCCQTGAESCMCSTCDNMDCKKGHMGDNQGSMNDSLELLQAKLKLALL